MLPLQITSNNHSLKMYKVGKCWSFFFLFFLAVMTKFVQQVFGFNLKGLGVVVNRIVVVKVLLQYKDFGF